jgi:hypothetical protein
MVRCAHGVMVCAWDRAATFAASEGHFADRGY